MKRGEIMLNLSSRFWWTFFFRGLLALLFGLARCFGRVFSLGVVVFVFAVYVFLEGVLANQSGRSDKKTKARYYM